MSIDPINEAFIAAASLQASDDIHKSFRKTFDLSQCTKVIPDTLTLLVRSLSDEVEARFERSFAQRDAELIRLRADVIALKDEVALTLASAKKCLDETKKPPGINTTLYLERFMEEKLKYFLNSKEFEEVVGQYFTDNWTGMQGVEDPDLTAKIRTTMCDILRHTAFVVPTS